jgi:hypothetical protein
MTVRSRGRSRLPVYVVRCSVLRFMASSSFIKLAPEFPSALLYKPSVASMRVDEASATWHATIAGSRREC